MELIDGPTLAEQPSHVGRVPPGIEGARGGPAGLPVDDALAIAKQIAEALDAAHEQDVIHRDLKPANIKLRSDGVVKVLDFGLAKLTSPGGPPSAYANATADNEGGHYVRSAGDDRSVRLQDDRSVRLPPDLTAAPTVTSPAMMTGAGMLLGTAAYMSPEQARGKPVDKRADIWAFGCVLYEMLASRRVFHADEVSDTLAMQSPLSDASGQFSPDGRWVAYHSNESGRFEIYVVPFPMAGGKWLISSDGGMLPRWRRDGKELFYVNENVVMAAEVNGAGPAFQVGPVRRLFEVQRRTESTAAGFGAGSVYDVSPDGQRFLVNVVAEEDAALPSPITVITNWTATLR